MSGGGPDSRLKPCPFCGDAKPFTEAAFFAWYAGCSNQACRATIAPQDANEEAAMAAWNQRAAITRAAPAKLAPCPFCARSQAQSRVDQAGAWVVCVQACGAAAFQPDEAAAIAAWNRRTP